MSNSTNAGAEHITPTTHTTATTSQAEHIQPKTHANAATGHTGEEDRATHPRRAADIPGDAEGPVHKSALLNELDPRVKAHPGSATTGGHHTIPKIGETHHQHDWKD